MLTRLHFPLPRWWFAVSLLLSTLAMTAPARAQDTNLLHGPHPFLRENELSAHFLLAAGGGDSWSGTKLAFDYGFRLQQPFWLDLQVNAQKGTCSLTPGNCARSGSAWETMAGAKAKFTTESPFVPYAKAVTGLIYLFPEQARSAVGLAVRVGGGIEYFFFDWFGLGIEGNLSLGHGFFDSSYTFGHGYVVFDFGGGVEFQF
jgi:hypothetical protein